MYIIYVNHDSVVKQICQLRDKAFLINETATLSTGGVRRVVCRVVFEYAKTFHLLFSI